MKKIIALILACLMILSFAACKKNETEPDATDGTHGSSLPTEQTEDTESIDGDPVEYGREYWENKYPGKNICPFSIDENGVERSYYWVSGLEDWDGTIARWIEQPFNWNGWHKTEDGSIVNKDETLKITDDWADGDESLSSCCMVTTESYDKDALPTEGDDEKIEHNVPKALSFKSQADLSCKENFVFAAVYEGSDEDKENDSTYFDFCNEDALYYVLTGFNEDDGAINHIWGYARLYHFYNDEASYKAALAEVPSYALKEQNDDALYFTTGNVRNTGAESYSELYDMINNKETDGGEFDHFAPYNG